VTATVVQDAVRLPPMVSTARLGDPLHRQRMREIDLDAGEGRRVGRRLLLDRGGDLRRVEVGVDRPIVVTADWSPRWTYRSAAVSNTG
jgi:hypothetical protein